MWKDNNKNLHDELDRDYLKDKFLRIPGEGVDNTGRIKLAELAKGKILDVACGTCINYEVMKGVESGGESGVESGVDYHGFDLTQQMISIALELFPELHNKLYTGYIQDMPFEADSFDTVIARHIFEHIPDWREAMRECMRVAKDYCYFAFYIHPDERDEIIKYVEEDRGNYYLNKYNIKDVEAMFEGREFVVHTTADLIFEVKI